MGDDVTHKCGLYGYEGGIEEVRPRPPVYNYVFVPESFIHGRRGYQKGDYRMRFVIRALPLLLIVLSIMSGACARGPATTPEAEPEEAEPLRALTFIAPIANIVYNIAGDHIRLHAGGRALRALFRAGRIRLNAPYFSHFVV